VPACAIVYACAAELVPLCALTHSAADNVVWFAACEQFAVVDDTNPLPGATLESWFTAERDARPARMADSNRNAAAHGSRGPFARDVRKRRAPESVECGKAKTAARATTQTGEEKIQDRQMTDAFDLHKAVLQVIEHLLR
jgi:hypothetical protein